MYDLLITMINIKNQGKTIVHNHQNVTSIFNKKHI